MYMCEVCDSQEWDSQVTVYGCEYIYVCEACRLCVVFSIHEDDWKSRCDNGTMWDNLLDDRMFSFGLSRSWIEKHGVDVDVYMIETYHTVWDV